MQVQYSDDEVGGGGGSPSEGDYEKGVYYDLFEENDQLAPDQPALTPEKQLNTDAKQEGKEKDKEIVRTKKRINILTFKPDRLTNERGLYAIVNEFPRIEFRGEGHEQQDLKLLMRHYEHWGNRMFPKLRFSDLLEKIESFGGRKEIKDCLSHIRGGGRVPRSAALVEEPEDDALFGADRQIGGEGVKGSPEPDGVEQELLNEEINRLAQSSNLEIDEMFEMAEFN